MTFESHTNLGKPIDSIIRSMERTFIVEGSVTTSIPLGPPGPPDRQIRPKAKGKSNLADNFCIYRTSDGWNIPTLAIEYKAPYKLTLDKIVIGLESEI